MITQDTGPTSDVWINPAVSDMVPRGNIWDDNGKAAGIVEVDN